MAKKASSKKDKKASTCECSKISSESGCFYFLGIIGAAIHYIGAASGFWQGVLGVLQALVWPVFVVLKILGM